MRKSTKYILQALKNDDPRLFAAALSLDQKLKQTIQQRYGSTSFKNVRHSIRYRYMKEMYVRKKSTHRSLMKNLSFKSLMKWLKTLHQQGKDYSKLLKHLATRYRGSVPDGLRKDEYILYKCGIEKIDKCKCGKYKLASKDKCRICVTMEKCKDTIKKKYGVDNISQHPDIKKKKVEKWKQNADKWIEKQRQTMLKKYGYVNASQVPEIKNQKIEKLKALRMNHDKFVEIMNEMFRKYGRFNQRWEIPEDIYARIKDSENPYYEYQKILYNERLVVDDRCELVTTFDEFYKSMVPKKVVVRCKDCGRESIFSIWGTKQTYLSCKYCNAYTSVAERQLFNWLKSLGFNPLLHYNRGTNEGELDIYIPEMNLAIEFQGLIWHANEDSFKRDKEKWNAYTKQGIRLFYIYEDDYTRKSPIVKSLLLHKLGVKHNQQTVYARNCQLVTFRKANETIKDFFDQNHIHGFVPGELYLLLIHSNSVVAGMIIGKKRFVSDSTYEVIRFCTKHHTHIPGGFSRLLKNAKKYIAYDKVIFYVDSAFGSNLLSDIQDRYSFLNPCSIQLLESSFYVVDLSNPYTKYHRSYASKESMKRYIQANIELDSITQDDMLQLAGFGKLFRPPMWRIEI